MDSARKSELLEKIREDNLEPGDLKDYMVLFIEICNKSEDIKEEVEDWDRTFQVILIDAFSFYFKIEEGVFSLGEGEAEDADITLEMSAEVAAGMFSGEVDATSAYMSQELKIQGPLQDAVKFRTLTEIVREELENL